MGQLEVPKIPWTREDAFHPPAGLAEFRAGPPARVLLPSGQVAWLVTRHADARAVLSDPRVSSDDTLPGYPQLVPLPPSGGLLSFLRMDDPDHGRLRRLLTTEFTVRRINAMRPGIERTVAEFLDAMVEAGPPADLVRDFALPVPSRVICQLLGVPYADHDFFQERTTKMLETTATVEEGGRAMAELGDYLASLVAAKVRDPGDDLLGRVASGVTAGRLTEDELASMARLLLIAGHETTANMLALGTLMLLVSGEWAALCADPSRVGAVSEELLRHLTIVQFGVGRVLTEPVTIDEVTMEAGDGVVISLFAANRDGSHFPDPDAFDPFRRQGHHMAFGFGAHQCLGAALARLEMDVAFTALAARLPGLRLAVPLEDVPFRPAQFVYGLGALPVAW
ncbi:cytochrome P450 [Actinocorallia populi]|uniref:cytochrome P450 n=1 Tax=Actinocorallia populi TaxID=2079200 RepID=UPI001300BAC2|nr:cytochrome P450 [Actinocorallia populi]